MSTIKVKTHLDSDTIRIPELQQFVGKDVEITVTEAVRPERTLLEILRSFDHVPVDLNALEELRRDSMI